MSKREPNLELLLNGGDLLALSPLRYGPLRANMLAALRASLPQHAQLDETDPGVALIEALAACLDVLGFYHDRILTESKLGSAVLLKSVARLGEVIGYRPRPPLAAVAYQFFLATMEGLIPAGCKVAGRAGEPPTTVVFETRSSITIGPAFNQMELSPIITRYAGAVRATLRLLTSACRADLRPSADLDPSADGTGSAKLLDQISIEQASLESLPLDDFRIGTLALLNGPHGLELCKVSSSRRRGVAFETPLVRSYDENATVISRATCIRHLRFWQPLGDSGVSNSSTAEQGPDQVVFEVTDRPILHYPNPASPEQLSSSLEVFVFDNSDEIGDPTTWDPKLAWKRVDDFSSSEASDHHYRVIVDDRLTSYIVLRRRLGYRVLLSDTALSRVYVRFVPAIGRLLAREPAENLVYTWREEGTKRESVSDSDARIATMGDVAMTLDPAYFNSALVRPQVTNGTVRNATTFAVIADDIGLKAGDRIAIQGGASGQTFFRTLTEKTHGRYLSWESKTEASPKAATVVTTKNETADPEGMEDVFDAAKTTIAPLSDVARGQTYPLWEAYYKQAQAPDIIGVELATLTLDALAPQDPTSVLHSDRLRRAVSAGQSRHQCLFVAKGTTYLLLEDTSNVKSGDYLLIGRRLRWGYRNQQAECAALDAGESSAICFNSFAPWLTAEVVQAVEIQGNLVRLKDAISQDFYRDFVSRGQESPKTFEDFYRDFEPVDASAQPTNNTWITDVVVVPAVASVYYGDVFSVPVVLDQKKAATPNKTTKVATRFLSVQLSESIKGPDFRAQLGWERTATEQWKEQFNRLFLAISGQLSDPFGAVWSRRVNVPSRGLLPRHIQGLVLAADKTKVISTRSPIVLQNGRFEIELEISGASTRAFKDASQLAALIEPNGFDLPQWTEQDDDEPPALGRFKRETAWYFLPKGDAAGSLDKQLLGKGGTLLITDLLPAPISFAELVSDRGLFVRETIEFPPVGTKLNVVAISKAGTFTLDGDTPEISNWTIDWEISPNFDSNGWHSLPHDGWLVLGNQTSRPLAYFRQGQNKLRLDRVPVEHGTPLYPHTGVDKLWALPTPTRVSVPLGQFHAIWRLELTPQEAAALEPSWSGLLSIWKGNDSRILAPASVELDDGNWWLRLEQVGDCRDLSTNLTKILALTKISVSERVVRVLESGPNNTPQVNESDLAVLEDSQQIIATAEFLSSSDGIPRALFSDASSKQLSDHARFLCYHRTNIKCDSHNASQSAADAPLVKTITVELPEDWPKSQTSESVCPLTTVLFTNKSRRTLREADVSLQSDGVYTLKFTGAFDLEETSIQLAFRQWSMATSQPTPICALEVVAPAPWSQAPEELELLFDDETAGAKALQGANATILIPSQSTKPFPPGAQGVYWCRIIRDGSIAAPILPREETVVHLPSTTPTELAIPEDHFKQIGYLVFGEAEPWTQHAITSVSLSALSAGGEWLLKIPEAMSTLFPGGIPDDGVSVRFVYDVSSTAAQDTCTALCAHGNLPPEKLQPLGAQVPSSTPRAVMFHDGNEFRDPLETSFAHIDSDGTFELPGNDVPGIFSHDDSRPVFPILSFIQSWTALLSESIVPDITVVTLGPAPLHRLTLRPEDELTLIDTATQVQTQATILRVTDTGAYVLDQTCSFSKIQLHTVGVGKGDDESIAARFSVTATATPPPNQQPWLLTTWSDHSPSTWSEPISAKLLRYDGYTEVGPGRYEFLFENSAAIERAYSAEANNGLSLRVYLNQRAILREDIYLSSLVAFQKDNFFRSDEAISFLFVKVGSAAFPEVVAARPSILFCDVADVNRNLEFGTNIRNLEWRNVDVVSQSLVFNSGNFIPVTGMNAEDDLRTIRNALRIWLEPDNQIATLTPVQYDSEASLAAKIKETETDGSTLEKLVGKCFYSFTKLPGGTFALNFLLIGLSAATARVYVEYAAPRIEQDSSAGAAMIDFKPEEVAALTAAQLTALTPEQYAALTSEQLDAISPATIDEASRIYQFETRIKVLNPRSELVVLDSGGLKANDYLFLHSTAANGNGSTSSNSIQWARVTAVAGPIVSMDSELNFNVAEFYHYFLCGYSRPPKPVQLDKEYYALLKTAVFEPDPTNPIHRDADPPDPQTGLVSNSYESLPLADRLIIEPNTVENQTLLAALVPGDQLLVWNERWRKSWYDMRLGGVTDGNKQWFNFAQYQHVAVIKSVDKDTGLVILSEPLPERFSVGLKVTEFLQYVEATDDQPATVASFDPRRYSVALDPANPGLCVLPHYGAPFQGKCSLKVLGSGDKNRKFARYTGTLGSDSGLGTITLLSEMPPAFSDKMYASNIEVLSREPRSGEWKRWVQFVSIDRAERKDRAFTLGVELGAVGMAADTIPFAVSFGDGKLGQLLPSGNDNVYARVTSIGGHNAHVESRRPLRILNARYDAAPFTVPPEAAAVPVNLWLRIEFGGHEAWSPIQGAARERPLADRTRGDWRSALLVEVQVPPGNTTVGAETDTGTALPFRQWDEINRAEAEAGYEGVFVQGVRPGVVDVFFFARRTIVLTRARAWEVPDRGTWILDNQFYGAMSGVDPSRTAGATHIGLRETDGIRPGSLLAFSRGDASTSEIVTVDTVDRDTWSATLTAGLTQVYPLETSFLRGNLVEVVQGSTETFILGSGDGSTRNLRLSLHNRSPILYAYERGNSTATPRVTVMVGGAVWSRVDEFSGCLPRDRVWRLDVETDTSAWVVFGDGVEGAVPPFGTNNITAAICTGVGEAGNLPTYAINKLLDGNLAVKETWNLTDASGGKEGETTGQIRDTLLGRKGGSDNVISVEDVARVALDVGEVLHARVDPTAPKNVLRLVVALEGRRSVTEQVRKTLEERIQARLPATCDMELKVASAEQVAVHLAVTIEVSNGYLPVAVLDAAERAFSTASSGFFASKRWPLGEPIRLGDIYETLFAVAGLASAQVTWLSTEKIIPLSSLVNEVINPGASGVIRCDNEPATDPHQNYGSIKFTLKGAVT